MQTKMNVKSLVLGLVLGSAIVLSVGAVSTQRAYNGRFQLVVHDGYVLKVDTATGQVWKAGLRTMSDGFKSPNIGQ